MEDLHDFKIIQLGIIFDTAKKKILIGRRENDPIIENLKWSFPGGRLNHGGDLNASIKDKIKEKTGLNTESLGIIFSKVYPKKENLLAIYHLCELIDGEEQALESFLEIKWVDPKELEKHFTTSFHPKLKEYVEGLVE